VSGRKDLQFFPNNFSTYKRIFTIFGTHYPDDTYYKRHVKFALKIYLPVCSVDVIMLLRLHLLKFFRGKL